MKKRAAVAAACLLAAGLSMPASATAQPGRHCESPPDGWYCLYEHAWWQGYSIAKSACGYSVLPGWFQNLTTSYIDRQYPTVDTRPYVHLHDNGIHKYTFFHRTYDNLPSSANDRADSAQNWC